MKVNNKYLVLLSFAVFFGWVMSLPYEGPVMYALAGERGINGQLLNVLNVFFHGAGLFCGRFYSGERSDVKRYLLISACFTLGVSLFIPAIPISSWMYVIPFLSFIMGTVISGFASLIVTNVPYEERAVFGADMLIYGNVVLIIAHVFANNTRPIVSFAVIEIIFLLGIFGLLTLDTNKKPVVEVPEKKIIPLNRYWIFFLFIFIVTINSGIMFQVIYPYFWHHGLLVSLYTNVPYIVAIFLLSRRIKSYKLNYLYLGLGLWGVTFIMFAFVGNSALAFVAVCTIMLGATGIFDYFWWSIMASNFESVENPAALMGTGLSLNVFGVWVGGILGNSLMAAGFNHMLLSFVGISVVMVCMIIILPLNDRLSELLEGNDFLIRFSYIGEKERKAFEDYAKDVLTNREYEVFGLLLQGQTDAQISKALHISMNTTKTHNRNIYRKLEVSNRVGLIEQFQND